MHRSKIIGLAFVAVLATAATTAGTAFAAAEVLEVREPHVGALSPPNNYVFGRVDFSFTSSAGDVSCEVDINSSLATNLAKKDTIEQGTNTENDYCAGTGVFTGSHGEAPSNNVPAITLGSKGKALASVSLPLNLPAPFEHCVVANSKLKGSNSLSGVLKASFSGKVTGTGCPTKKLAASTTLVELKGPFGNPLEADLV